MCEFMAKIISRDSAYARIFPPGAQILSGLTVIYVDIINHLPASVNAGSTNSSTARDISSSSPSGLERFLVIVLLVCVAAMEEGNEMYFSIVLCGMIFNKTN